MLSSEFVQAYPLNLPETVIHHGHYAPEVAAQMVEAQKWSYTLGRYVHAYLSGTEPDSFTTPEEHQSYTGWVGGTSQMEAALTSTAKGWEARNEFNFHCLNRHMLGMWRLLLTGGWESDQARTRAIDVAQNKLAMQGLHYFKARQDFVDEVGTEALFEHPKDVINGYLTGLLQELDAGIILLSAMRRHPGLTVLPAPMQFERSTARANVDHLVIDPEGKRAVGVQVRTQVREGNIDAADTDRVVFIDGTVDLGNVKVMRIRRGSSRKDPKPWPGIIAADRVSAIPTRGKHFHNEYVNPKSIPVINRAKFLAKNLLQGMTVDPKHLTGIIEERVMAKL